MLLDKGCIYIYDIRMVFTYDVHVPLYFKRWTDWPLVYYSYYVAILLGLDTVKVIKYLEPKLKWDNGNIIFLPVIQFMYQFL